MHVNAHSTPPTVSPTHESLFVNKPQPAILLALKGGKVGDENNKKKCYITLGNSLLQSRGSLDGKTQALFATPYIATESHLFHNLPSVEWPQDALNVYKQEIKGARSSTESCLLLPWCVGHAWCQHPMSDHIFNASWHLTGTDWWWVMCCTSQSGAATSEMAHIFANCAQYVANGLIAVRQWNIRVPAWHYMCATMEEGRLGWIVKW